jgi:hydrogenase nickel incorporation protein HypA/HybF
VLVVVNGTAVVPVHELSLCSLLYDVVERARDGQPVETVELTVGRLRQVVPETLAACWQLVTCGTPLAGSVLRIDHVPVTLSCGHCGRVTQVDEVLVVACGHCESADVRVVSGEEFLVHALELADG